MAARMSCGLWLLKTPSEPKLERSRAKISSLRSKLDTIGEAKLTTTPVDNLNDAQAQLSGMFPFAPQRMARRAPFADLALVRYDSESADFPRHGRCMSSLQCRATKDKYRALAGTKAAQIARIAGRRAGMKRVSTIPGCSKEMAADAEEVQRRPPFVL
jgi:hypothetical protein